MGGSAQPHTQHVQHPSSIPLLQSRDIPAGSMALGQAGIILFEPGVLNPINTSPHPSVSQSCWGFQPPCLTALPGQGLSASFSQNVPSATWPWHLMPQAWWNGCPWKFLELAVPSVTPNTTPLAPDRKQNPVKSQPGAGKGEQCSNHTEPPMS